MESFALQCQRFACLFPSEAPSRILQLLRKPITQELRKHIPEQVWNKSLTSADFEQMRPTYDPYFRHYEVACQNCSTDDVGRLTHGHLLQALECVETKDFDACMATLSASLAKQNSFHVRVEDVATVVREWINFTGSALLLLDLSGWKGAEMLKDHLGKDQFSHSTQEDAFRIFVSFNLKNLQEIGGMEIRWPDLLSEHLALEKEDTRLAVFHQVSMLEVLESSALYPQGLADEVRLTSAILLPREDAKSRKWFRNQRLKPARRAPGSALQLDPAFDSARGLKPWERNIRSLNYLKDRIMCVKELYDSHEPQTFLQQYRDSRRPARRWAFVIAILVFLFGTGQLIGGAIQCYKAYYPSHS